MLHIKPLLAGICCCKRPVFYNTLLFEPDNTLSYFKTLQLHRRHIFGCFWEVLAKKHSFESCRFRSLIRVMCCRLHSDEINEVSTPGISGWISSTTYNGSRLLIQRDLKETPVLEAARLELASVVLGTCEWLLGPNNLSFLSFKVSLSALSQVFWKTPMFSTNFFKVFSAQVPTFRYFQLRAPTGQATPDSCRSGFTTSSICRASVRGREIPHAFGGADRH